jgi:AhpD family alkylhydroperoxidase
MENKTLLNFIKERQELNKLVMEYADINIKRIFAVDAKTYIDGALPARMKELIGLVASFVLRCDDCVKYHLIQCRKHNITDEELTEALSIGLLIGGSITIPHLRRAFKDWNSLKKRNKDKVIL